ncbi:ATP-binding protein [Algoriphagus pacificus]|uniref:histidine kinase n=1 Tax=Algoriphagus pacificus TaxID=2811234 RepID=A0ABS3CCQ1_9BACT|nr:ATP-binding protein [Algoriphagus pacificus]MBN7814605.1 nuclear transport factor 2 family protein [Algoriphagus pacificus]
MERDKNKLLIDTYQEFMNVGISGENPSLLEKIVDENIVGFGTAIDEKVQSLKEFKKLLENQKNQSTGLQVSWRTVPMGQYTSADENTVVFAEDLYLTIQNEEESIEMYFRFSSVLNYSNNQWKVIHWHGSKPEPVESDKDTWGIENYKKKAEELEKLVSEKTADLLNKNRELEIESALERVRAQSLAMHHSSELSSVVDTLLQEFTNLEFTLTFCIINLIDEEDMSNTVWAANPETGKDPESYYMKFEDYPFHDAMWDAWKAQKKRFVYTIEGEEKKIYDEYLYSKTEFSRFPKHVQDANKALERYVAGFTFFKYSGLQTVSENYISEQDLDILERFGKVFEQAYTRFLDLQKAEAQTRESEIQLALERVRSRSMSMHSSSEIGDTALVVFQELNKLGIDSVRGGLALIDTEKDEAELWLVAEKDGKSETKILGSAKGGQHYFYRNYIAAARNGEDYFFAEMVGKELIEYYKIASTSLNVPTPEEFPEREFYYGFFFAEGSVNVISRRKLLQSELSIGLRFAKVFGLVYRRFLDLQKAEAQARESEIQLALERVRARTMAMQESKELAEASSLLFQQLHDLGVNTYSSRFTIWDEEKDELISWMCNADGSMNPPFRMPISENEWHQEQYKHWKNKKSFVLKDFKGEEMQSYFNYLRSFPLLDKAFEISIAAGNPMPERQIHHVFNFSHGNLLFITLEPYVQAHDIFMRFAKVFDQTYTRFIDLLKAEEQAKEARIEAALERVRSRTMGMQKAEELGEVATVLFRELNALVDNLWTCGFVLCEKNRQEDEWWLSLDNGLIQPFSLPNVGDFAHENLYEGWEKGEAYRTVTLENKKLQEHYDWLMKIPIAAQIFEEMEASGIPRPKWQRLHAAYFKTGYLVIIKEVPCEEEEIFKRFAQVFDLTYTRFLDLSKAEAQAKEAKLELSLQRIRAQVTAMSHSDELFDIVVSMRKEFVLLGHEADYFWHMKWTPESYEMSMTSEEGDRVGMIISVPKFVHDEIPRLAAWEKSDSPIIALDLNGPEAWDYIDKMNTYGKYHLADPHAPSEEDILSIGGLTFVIARTTHGEIGFSLPGQVPNPPEESLATLVRFASVFDLAYRRFEDLLTSEKQTRKAKIELALERVRARAMAMQEPEELIEVAQVMREEMGLLGVEELETSSIYINKSAGEAECWYSIKDIRDGKKTYLADHFNLNYNETWVGRQMLDFYTSDQTKTSILMKGENRVEWINYCANQSPKLDGYYGTKIPERTYHLTKFSNGAIGAATPGEISSESWDLLHRAALVFSLAYSRFKDLSQAKEDLKRLKKAKARAEKALTELKAAQEQLVQQEKLASLGQLTAGIAHEIKNPLNFVNNFSDLSRELIEEVFEELENLESSDTKEEIIAILEDVKSNLAKVHEHGTRADGIVKSMLQHSRASGNNREEKAFNPLVKEFVNLSFHGMRAGKSPINVEIEFQLGPEVGEISLISEDFSRVILNLSNNAFDAMREKLKSSESGRYTPKLTVKTSKLKDKVALSIEDNGPGIPEEILGKILQPFFTTKKGTEGTGLGLSITHDIIKAHGGELKVNSSVGTGTEMIITLPLDPK